MNFNLTKKIDKLFHPQKYRMDTIRKPLYQLSKGDFLYIMVVPNIKFWTMHSLFPTIVKTRIVIADRDPHFGCYFLQLEPLCEQIYVNIICETATVRKTRYNNLLVASYQETKKKKELFVKHGYNKELVIFTTDKKLIIDEFKYFIQETKYYLKSCITSQQIKPFKQRINKTLNHIYNL